MRLTTALIWTFLCVAYASPNAAQLDADSANPPAEGFVVVEFDISPAGEVSNPRVISSEPGEFLDAAALKAVLAWTYDPAEEWRRNVRSKIPFRLTEKPKP